MRPLDGAVGDDHTADALLLQVAGGELDGLAGAHQQGGVATEVGKELARQGDGGEGHRHRRGADGGVGAYLLGDAEGVLVEAVEDGPQGARLAGAPVRFLHLAEDLRLPQDHGIQPRGHPQQVTYRRLVRVDVHVRLDLALVQPMVVGEPAADGGGVLQLAGAIEFGAVAGGEDGGLVHRRLGDQVAQRLGDALRREGDPLTDFHRCGLVVDAEGEKAHASSRVCEVTENSA